MVDITKNDEVRSFLKDNGYLEQYNDGLLAFLREYFNAPHLALNDLLQKFTDGSGINVLPSKFVNFVGGSVPADFTFTRASVGTYFDSNGILQTATTNTPRIAYTPSEVTLEFTSAGLLLESSTTNEMLWSEDLTNAAYTKTNTTITSNGATAPDGTTTADAVIENAGTGSKILGVSSIGTVNSGDYYTYSLFAKQGPGDTRYIRCTLSGTALSGVQNAAFSLVSGITNFNGTDAVRTRSFILPDGWFRFEFTVQASSNGSIVLTNRNTTSFSLTQGSFTGDGISGTYQWGHQGSIDEFGSSYIKTEGSTATRAADVLSITGSNFTDFYNASEGTFVVSATNIFDYQGTYFSVDDGTSNEEMSISRNSSDESVGTITDGGAGQMSITLSDNTSTLPVRMALAYKANDSSVAVNGVEGTVDTSVTIPTVTQVRFALPAATSFYLKCFSYFNTRITNIKSHTT